MNYQILAPSQKAFTVMCNGLPGLTFQQNPEAFTGFEGEWMPQLFVFGQARKYGQLHSTGSFKTIGVNVQPPTLKTIFGLQVNELTDQSICISLLAKTTLTEQLCNSDSIQAQITSLTAFLLEQANTHEEENKKLNYAVSALQAGKKLSQVLNDLKISGRSLERLFLTHIGITPILYIRIQRFQKSISLLVQGRFHSLTDIAYSLGYFDQSHFIRDFKLFSGVSPSIYLRKAVERMPGFPEWQE